MRIVPSAATHDPLFDLIRGIAAQAVLFGHMYSLLAIEPTRSFAWDLIRLASSKSHEAVVVFFFLSGLLVGARVLDQVANGKFDIADYGLRRFARLYSVIIPGLFLTAICVWLTFAMQSGHLVVNQNRPWFPIWFSSEHSNSFSTFACNLVGLQMIGCYQYGHNLSAWSLSNETIYYALFPTLLIASTNRFSVAARGLSAAFAGVLIAAIFVSPTTNDPWRAWIYVSGFMIWCLGAVKPRLIAVASTFNVGALLILMALTLTVAELLSRVWITPVHDLGLALMLFVLLTIARIPFVTSLVSCITRIRLFKVLADYSYSLYFIHLPILLLMIAWMPRGFFEQNLKLSQSGTGLAVFLGMVLIINACSFTFAHAFEARAASLYSFTRVFLHAKLDSTSSRVT